MLNQSEKYNFNTNFVKINKIQNQIICVWEDNSSNLVERKEKTSLSFSFLYRLEMEQPSIEYPIDASLYVGNLAGSCTEAELFEKVSFSLFQCWTENVGAHT